MNQRRQVPFTFQEELFLFSSLMLLTCFFLPWRGLEDSPWQMATTAQVPVILFAWMVLALLICVTPLMVKRPNVRPWLAIVTALVINGALTVNALRSGDSAYGADLARLFALVLLFLSASPAVVKASDLAMRRLNSQQGEEFTHWGTVLPVHFSAQEFYAKLETAIREREWPGVELLRVMHSEAGLLSHKREYLRIVRQRQVFDICASRFGKDYFFTMREAEIRAQLSFVTLLIFLLVLFLIFSWLIGTVGMFSGAMVFGTILLFGVLLLFNVLRMGLTRLDGLLLRTPVIGPIYETWFRRSTTYFQHDARMVFLKLMDDLMKAHVDEETSAQGIKLLPCFEHQPILDGLYKTSRRRTGGEQE